jgi:hypothetical protein
VLWVSIKLLHFSLISFGIIKHRRSCVFFLANFSSKVKSFVPNISLFVSIVALDSSVFLCKHLPFALLYDRITKHIALPSVFLSGNTVSLNINLSLTLHLTLKCITVSLLHCFLNKCWFLDDFWVTFSAKNVWILIRLTGWRWLVRIKSFSAFLYLNHVGLGRDRLRREIDVAFECVVMSYSACKISGILVMSQNVVSKLWVEFLSCVHFKYINLVYFAL